MIQIFLFPVSASNLARRAAPSRSKSSDLAPYSSLDLLLGGVRAVVVFEDGVLRLFRKRADAVLQKVSLKHLLPAGEKVLLPRGLDEQGHGGLLLCFDTKEYSTARAKKQKKRPMGIFAKRDTKAGRTAQRQCQGERIPSWWISIKKQKNVGHNERKACLF